MYCFASSASHYVQECFLGGTTCSDDFLKSEMRMEHWLKTEIQFQMIHDHALMINYHKHNQQVHVEICKYIVV